MQISNVFLLNRLGEGRVFYGLLSFGLFIDTSLILARGTSLVQTSSSWAITKITVSEIFLVVLGYSCYIAVVVAPFFGLFMAVALLLLNEGDPDLDNFKAPKGYLNPQALSAYAILTNNGTASQEFAKSKQDLEGKLLNRFFGFAVLPIALLNLSVGMQGASSLILGAYEFTGLLPWAVRWFCRILIAVFFLHVAAESVIRRKDFFVSVKNDYLREAILRFYAVELPLAEDAEDGESLERSLRRTVLEGQFNAWKIHNF